MAKIYKEDQRRKIRQIIKAAQAACAADMPFKLTAHKYVGKSTWWLIDIDNECGTLYRIHKNDPEEYGINGDCSPAIALQKLEFEGGLTNICLSVGRLQIKARTIGLDL